MNIAVSTKEFRQSLNGEEVRQKSIEFVFDPDEIEMVRAKDGAYIIRTRRPKSVEAPAEHG